jgi:hypothetical protein
VSDVREFFDSQIQEDKSRQDDLRRAKEAIAGPVPLIAAAPDCSVELPRGLYVRGEFKRQALVRELTGADEEALARMRDGEDFLDLVLALGTVSIDDFDLSSMPVAERQGHLRQLLIGERDQLFLSITRATFGERKTMNFTCSTCREEQEIDLLLSEDFPLKGSDDVTTMVFTYTTSKDQELQYRLATGADQIEAFAKKGASVAEQNTIILSRVITKANGEMLVDPMAYVRSLSIRDRQALLTELVAKQPTIDLTISTRCAACGLDQRLGLQWVDLFRP